MNDRDVDVAAADDCTPQLLVFTALIIALQ